MPPAITAAAILQPRQLVEPVDAAGDAAPDQPAQPGGRDAPVGDAAGGEQLRHARPLCSTPALPRQRHRREGLRAPLGAGGHLRGAEGLGAEPAVAEEAHRQAHAADLERLGQQRLAAMAQDHLGGAPADVDHEARCRRGLQVRHAGIDEARLLAPGDDLDRMAEHGLRAPGRRRGCAPAQGLCTWRAPAAARSLQALGKAAQAGQLRAWASVSRPSASSPPPRRTVSLR